MNWQISRQVQRFVSWQAQQRIVSSFCGRCSSLSTLLCSFRGSAAICALQSAVMCVLSHTCAGISVAMSLLTHVCHVFASTCALTCVHFRVLLSHTCALKCVLSQVSSHISDTCLNKFCSHMYALIFTSLRDGNRPHRMEGDNTSTESRKEARAACALGAKGVSMKGSVRHSVHIVGPRTAPPQRG